MAKMKYGYGWLIKWILAAVLLGVGIYMALEDEAVYTIVGIAITIYSLFRVYPLMKTLNKEILRTINLIEIIVDVVLGAVMVYAGLKGLKGDDAEMWSKLFRWFLAFFFYIRGVIFFTSTTFFGEKTEVPKFIFHIVAITLGAVIAMWEGFDAGTLGILFLFISVSGAVYLGYDGYGGYSKYRNYQKILNQDKQKQVKIKVDKELPKEDPQKEKEIPTQPQQEEEKQEETYIS